MSENEMLDKVLADYAAGRDLGLISDPSSYRSAIRKIAAYELVYPSTRNLTQRGVQVLEAGGFEQWKAAIERQETETRQAALDSASATVDTAKSAKRSLLVAWISGLVAILAFLFSLLQWWDNRQSQSEVGALRLKVTELDSLLKAQRLNSAHAPSSKVQLSKQTNR